ncbi:hypothetical protein ACWGDX_13215 [Streptomyces sp. NPDC055025]
MKKLMWILAALVAVVLFPGLPGVVAAIAAQVAVWASGDRFLVGLIFGLVALPQLRQAAYRIKY